MPRLAHRSIHLTWLASLGVGLLLWLTSVAVVYAANPIYVYVGGFQWYTSGAHPASSSGKYCDFVPFTWDNSLAYRLAHPDYAPDYLYYDYVDFYDGDVSASGSFFFAEVWLYPLGEVGDELEQMSDHSFFTYDITVWIYDWVSFDWDQVIWEAPVAKWGPGGPDLDCAFVSWVDWYR